MTKVWIACVAMLISCNNGADAHSEKTGDTPALEPAQEVAQQLPDNTSLPPTDSGTAGAAMGQDEIPLGIAYTHFFDADNAWAHLEKQLSFGFRVPGTDGHRSCKAWLKKELEKHCDWVGVQEFSVPLKQGPTPFYNVMGRINPDAPRRILLAAHWDTRPTADENPAGSTHKPIAGANDGASGVAVLLELARVFGETPPPQVGVDIVLFDGEDYGPGINMMFLGAKHFASTLEQSELNRYNYGILLDMIGDKNLDIHPESNSEGAAGKVYAVAYELSEQFGYGVFKSGGGYEIYDDHLPLIARGVRMYDFIDFNYSYWHTTQDTADKCDKYSLKAVGHVVENMIYMHPEIYGPND